MATAGTALWSQMFQLANEQIVKYGTKRQYEREIKLYASQMHTSNRHYIFKIAFEQLPAIQLYIGLPERAVCAPTTKQDFLI